MRESVPRLRRLLAALVLVLAFPLGAAQAQSLDTLRASGAVGEKYDGYAVVRDAAAGAGAVVDDVNAKRRQIYAQRAAEQGVPVDQVGRVYAEEILRKAKTGWWFLSESGAWSQK